MDVVNISDLRQRLKEVLDRVVTDMTQVVVTRQKAAAVVMVSLDEWNTISETLHLLSSPKNAARLHDSIRELDAGKGAERELFEEPELEKA